jgi:hypothetical protein
VRAVQFSEFGVAGYQDVEGAAFCDFTLEFSGESSYCARADVGCGAPEYDRTTFW